MRLEPDEGKLSRPVPRGGGNRKVTSLPDQIKQTLQLADFLGTSANAVRWQIWSALLVYLLLRYLAFLSQVGLQIKSEPLNDYAEMAGGHPLADKARAK